MDAIASFLRKSILRCWGKDLNSYDCVGLSDTQGVLGVLGKKLEIDDNIISTNDTIIREKFGISDLEDIFFLRDTSTWCTIDSGTAITQEGIYLLNNDGAKIIKWDIIQRVEYKGKNFIFFKYPNEEGVQNYQSIHQSNFIKTGNPSSALINNLLKLFNKVTELAAPVEEDDPADAIIERIEANEDNPQAIINIAMESLYGYPSISEYLKFEIGRNYYKLDEYQKAKRYLLEADNCNLSDYYQTWLNTLLGDIYEELDFKLSRNRRLAASKGSQELEFKDEDLPATQLALKDLLETDARYFSNLDSHPYAEHKLIYPVDDLTKLSTLDQNQIMVVELRTLREANLDFPMGHPVAKQLYVCHPFCQNKFIPFENYELEFLEDRIREFCEIAQCLGASSIKIEAINEESKDEKSSLDGSIGIRGGNRVYSGNVNVHGKCSENIVDQLRNSMEFEQHFSTPVIPHIPENTIWLTKEPSWQRLIQQRMQGNLSRHREVISTSKSRLIEGNALLELNAEVKSLYADMGLNFSVELSNRLQTTQNASLSITVEFFPLHQSNEDESPTRIEQDSKENKSSFFKRLFK